MKYLFAIAFLMLAGCGTAMATTHSSWTWTNPDNKIDYVELSTRACPSSQNGLWVWVGDKQPSKEWDLFLDAENFPRVCDVKHYMFLLWKKKP